MTPVILGQNPENQGDIRSLGIERQSYKLLSKSLAEQRWWCVGCCKVSGEEDQRFALHCIVLYLGWGSLE